MDSLQFDYLHGWAVMICVLIWLAVAVVPAVTGLRAGRPLAVLRGALLSVTGSLFLVRAESSLQHAAQVFLADLHPTLPAALMLAVLALVWVGIWTVVLPQIGDAVTGAPKAGWAVLWLGGGLLSLYFAIFVLGGMPGALARGFSEQGLRAEQAQREHAAKMDLVRKANAAALCSFSAESLGLLSRRVTRTDRIRRAESDVGDVGRRWGVDVAGQAATCNTQAERLTLVQAKAAAGEIAGAVLRATGTAPRAPVWTNEPTATSQVSGLAEMKLSDYFDAALWSPIEHMARLFSNLDLAVTFVLLGEIAAAVLWLLDVCLQRRAAGPRAAEDVDTGTEFIMSDS